MSERKLRVGLIGCGIISEAHVRAYAKHVDRARITVCCDVDRSKAEQRARDCGAGKVVTRLEDVLSDPDVDAVDVCTPHHLHTDAVVAACRAGKHVLCQKPLAKSLADCDRMIAAACEAGVVLYYAESNHTTPSADAAKRAVSEGRIGTMIGVQATHAHWQGGKYMSTAWRYDPNITGGGQLLDGGIHALDLMLNVGGPVCSVSCFTTRFRPELGGEDTAVVNLRYEAGHLGSLFSSQAAAMWIPGANFIAYGTEGILAMGGPHGGLTLYCRDLPDEKLVLIDGRQDSFAVMIGRYLDAVLDGKPNPSPAEVGRENLRVVLASYESARLGREVTLDEVERPSA